MTECDKALFFGLKLQKNELKLKKFINHIVLTQIGIGGDTFISLSFLNQILSADFLSKNFKKIVRWKFTSIGLIWHPAKLIESLDGAKDEHFSCFHNSYQWRLKPQIKLL